MSKPYSRQDLIQAIAQKHSLSKAEAERIILGIFSEMQTALKKSRRVAMFPFGSFQVRKRAARKGRNPQTGTSVKIPARKVIKFQAYAGLKKAIGG